VFILQGQKYLTQFLKEMGSLNVINAYIPQEGLEGCHKIRFWEDFEALEVMYH